MTMIIVDGLTYSGLTPEQANAEHCIVCRKPFNIDSDDVVPCGYAEDKALVSVHESPCASVLQLLQRCWLALFDRDMSCRINVLVERFNSMIEETRTEIQV